VLNKTSSHEDIRGVEVKLHVFLQHQLLMKVNDRFNDPATLSKEKNSPVYIA
jgi:hypothetical protein